LLSTIASPGASCPLVPSGALNARSKSHVNRSPSAGAASVTRVYATASDGTSSSSGARPYERSMHSRRNASAGADSSSRSAAS
jgi:hypothetical protein